VTRRLCFALDLLDDAEAIAAYRRWHAPGGPPEGVLRRLRARGVEAMEIWLTGNRLFMVMEVSEAFAAAASDDSSDPEDRDWEARMDVYQRPLPWAEGTKWTAMEKIFAL
jgi:L-rhamnose mutarotase